MASVEIYVDGKLKRYTQCDAEGCKARVRDHAWGVIKADGWFFQKNGDSWCPDHIPDWYWEWKGVKKPRGRS